MLQILTWNRTDSSNFNYARSFMHLRIRVHPRLLLSSLLQLLSHSTDCSHLNVGRESRVGRAVTRLASQSEDTGSMPGAGSHIIHLFIVYIYRIHYRPTDGDVKWRSRVLELYSGHVKEPGWLVEFHVSLYQNSALNFISSFDRNNFILFSDSLSVLQPLKKPRIYTTRYSRAIHCS